MASGLDAGFVLDRRWHWLRGEMEQSKRPALLLLARVLGEKGVPYAVIGGVALQVHQEEPRTTLDIDLAVNERAQIPSAELEAAGFERTGSYEHSENWLGPGRTPVQFTDDPELRGAIARAQVIELDEATLRVISVVDLLHEKFRAGSDPARRRSKRLQDLADVQALLEKDPTLAATLSADERALLDRLRSL